MSTYIQGVQGENYNTVHGYQPDYNFLTNLLDKKEGQYQQGLSEVQSGYSAITNAPISNDENKVVKEQYQKNIQEGLKKLAITDLSLPRNVTQAESLYAPFWQDTDLLYDISKTKDIQTQLQRGESDRTSKDKDIRDIYDPYSIDNLQWTMQDLRAAKRGDGSIAAINVRQYTPQIDPNTYMDGVDKAEGFKGADFETPDGKAGIIKEHDGIKAIPNFTSRINAALGPQFNAQFGAQGYNWYRREKARVLQDNPGIPESEVNRKLGEQRYNDLKKIYSEKVTELASDIKNKFDDPIAIITKEINSTNQGGKATPEQQASIDKLTHQRQQYQDALDKASDENTEFQRNPEKLISDISAAPGDYYTRQVREITVANMAKGRAMGDYSYAYDVNKAWVAASTDADWRTNAELRSQGLTKDYYDINIRHQDTQDKMKLDNGYIYGPDGKLTPGPTTPGTATPQYIAENITSEGHGHFASLLQQEENTNLNTAVSSMFSMSGVSGVLSLSKDEGGLGISPGILSDFNTLYQRKYSPENIANDKFTSKTSENAAFETVYNALSTYFGKDKVIPKTYGGVRDAMTDYVATENAKRVATGTFTDMNAPFASAFTASEISKDAMNNYNAIHSQEKEWIGHLASTDKAKYRQLLNNQGTGFATEQDIAPHMPVYTVTDSKGNRRNLPKQELAKAYNRGTPEDFFVDGKTIKLNGQTYTIDAVNGQPNEDHYIEHGMHTGYPSLNVLGEVQQRFGSFTDRAELNKQLAENAAGNLQFIKDKTGAIGGKFHYPFGNEKNEGPGEKLVREALEPANSIRYMNPDGTLLDKEGSDNLVRIRGLANSGANIRKHIGEPAYSGVSEYGAPITTFTVNGYTDEDGKVHKAQDIVAVQSPNAKGEFISSQPKSSAVYVYQKLLKGESYTSDNMSNSMGFRYSVDPDNRDNPTSETITITYRKLNKATGKMEDYTQTSAPVPLSTGPDKIMAQVKDIQRNALVQMAAEQKYINNQNAR